MKPSLSLYSLRDLSIKGKLSCNGQLNGPNHVIVGIKVMELRAQALLQLEVSVDLHLIFAGKVDV